MIEILLLALVFSAGTWLSGWWGLVVVALVWSLVRRAAPWRVSLAAGLSWAGLLGLTIPWAPLGRLAPRLGGIFGAPGWVALVLPPLFAMVLAWSAARVVSRPRATGFKG